MKVLFLGIILLCSVWGQTQKIDSILRKELKNQFANTEVAVALIRGDQIEYLGYRQSEDELSHVDNQDRIFEIGSITKVFTAMILAQMHLEGKVDVNQAVRKYTKLKIKGKPEFTFRQLANHSSGLPRLPGNALDYMEKSPENPYQYYDYKALKEYLAKELELQFEPGSGNLYSNLGSGLLAVVLGEVDGKCPEDLYGDRIFRPLEMNQSSTDRGTLKEEQLVGGLNAEGGSQSYWDFSVLGGAGCILSTVTDLSRFALYCLNSDQAVNQLMRSEYYQINDGMKVGLGWHLIGLRDRSELLWHNGATGGFSSSMLLDPDRKLGVILLSNISPMSPNGQLMDRLGMRVMELLKREEK